VASTSEELFEAIEAGDAGRVQEMLQADPALATARDAQDVSALMRARYRFDPPLLDAVRSRVDELDVFEAAALGDVERLRSLLDADPALASAYSGDGFTALHFAAFFGSPAATSSLLERGAQVDALGQGWMTGTALHSAVSRREAEVARLLLEAGAGADLRQSGGWTPLHAAAANGDLADVELLLAAGADPTATNDEGRSVAELAEESGDEATIARIEAAIQAAP
jgi:ankyrin repeat protein